MKKEKDKVASDGMGTMHVNPHHTHILALHVMFSVITHPGVHPIIVTLCTYAQQGYAFGHVALCTHVCICGQKTGCLGSYSLTHHCKAPALFSLSLKFLVSIAELERNTIYVEVTKSQPLNDVNVDHPLWAGPRTWRTHETRIYQQTTWIQLHTNKSN